ncbi:MAG: NosD domain-containing protein, partial [Candidatus Kariarchaeaceae archaeon]
MDPPEEDDGWYVDDIGTYFEITDSNYPNIALTSSEIVHVYLESSLKMAIFHIESETSATSTQITLAGFEPNKIYYRYQDGNYQEELTTDETGSYSYTQDISTNHHVFISEDVSTYYIRDDATGGDGSSIGTWDWPSKTLTLTADVNDAIVIEDDGITLDGAGYTIQGLGSGNGVYLNSVTDVTITNCNIAGFTTSILLYQSNGNTLLGNTLSSDTWYNRIIYLHYSDNNIVEDNTLTSSVKSSVGIFVYYSNTNTVQGNSMSTSLVYGQGIYLTYSNSNTINDNSVSGYNAGISISYSLTNDITFNILTGTGSGWGIVLGISENSIISNNDVSDYGRGLWVQASNSVTINDNIISDTSTGVDISYSSYTILNGNTILNTYWGIMIRSNDFGQNVVTENQISSLYNSIHVGGSVETTVTSNVLSSGGITLTLCEDSTVSGNTVTGINPNLNIMYIHESAGSTVNGNILSGSGLGIYSQSPDITITGNSLNSVGILLGGSATNNLVNSNTFTNSITGIALQGSAIQQCSWNTIRSNTFTSVLVNGLIMRKASNNLITENTFSASGGSAISSLESESNTIQYNIFSGNAGGVLLWALDVNEDIIDNTFSNNDYGITLSHVNQHTIMRNTISDSIVHGIYLHDS